MDQLRSTATTQYELQKQFLSSFPNGFLNSMSSSSDPFLTENIVYIIMLEAETSCKYLRLSGVIGLLTLMSAWFSFTDNLQVCTENHCYDMMSAICFKWFGPGDLGK